MISGNCAHADVDKYRRNLCFLIWLEMASPEWLSLWEWLMGQWDSDDDKSYCSKSKSIHNEWAGVTKNMHNDILIFIDMLQCWLLSGAGLTLFKSWPQRGELPYIQKTQGKLRPPLSQSIIQGFNFVRTFCCGGIPHICHFFTQPQFEATKFYTWNCINSQQKL